MVARGGGFATPAPGASGLVRWWLVTIGQRLEKGNNGVFLCITKAEMTHLLRIDVGRLFRRRPACHLLAGIPGLAPRKHIPRVVEMHNLLQAFEVPVVHVGFDEIRSRPFVDIAQR